MANSETTGKLVGADLAALFLLVLFVDRSYSGL